MPAINIPVIDAARFRELMPMSLAVDVLDRAFASGMPDAPLRSAYSTGNGELLSMPSWDAASIGVKLTTLTLANPGRGLPFIHSVFTLFDAETGMPRAVIDGGALTEIRTAATSAVATRHLAAEDATTLVVFGAGRQGAAHLDAMLAVRGIERCIVVNRSPERGAALVERARSLGVAAELGDASAVRDADIVCLCTTSATPLFSEADLPERVHLNAIGAYRPDLCEVGPATVASSDVVVENREAAEAEAGDLIQAAASGLWSWRELAGDLGELAGGTLARRSARSLFKGVGIAGEDLAVATAVAALL